MYDIVFPKGNENEFIRTAVSLGIKGLIMCYDKTSQHGSKKWPFPIVLCKINNKQSSGGVLNISLCDRKFLEQKHTTFVYNAEKQPGRDHIHQRRSGLNQVLAALACKNNITILFNYRQLFDKKQQHLILGKMEQNARIIRKAKCKYAVVSCATKPTQLRNPKDVEAMYSILGLDKKDYLQEFFKQTL
ncbi:hypothetical protein JW868_04325 [Candidatus Woesearchaeota archaeon]|nr:hypothetical protein [Candidatus Woesearchaeota archaeon]